MSDISLEIHHLDVVGGDATVILIWDLEKKQQLYSVLIDSGAEESGSAYLEAYLKSSLITDFNLMIATHYHKDHIKGLSTGSSITFEKFIDTGGYNDKNGETIAAPNGIGDQGNTSVFANYKTRITSMEKATRVKLPFIQATKTILEPFSIFLGDETMGIKLTCYCANGVLANGDNIVDVQRKKEKARVNANDLCTAFVLEWGKFRYFTAGDLSGDPKQIAYCDIEGPLVDYLRKKNVFPDDTISVLKASHHGSEHSNQKKLLALVEPKIIVISANQVKQVPSDKFLARVNSVKPTPQIVISNRLTVHATDARFTPLKTLLEGGQIISGNLQTDEKQALSNAHVKCVVIRRRIKDGRATDYSDRDDKSEGTVASVMAENNAYQVVMKKRDNDEKNKIEKQSTPDSYKLTARWLVSGCSPEDIKDGFTRQAEAMMTWFSKDKKNGDKKIGLDYVRKHYPAFESFFEEEVTKEQFIKQMLTMFNETFGLTEDKSMFAPRSSQTLNAYQMQTLYNLLKGNSKQEKYNQANNAYGVVNYWNEAGGDEEPYLTGAGKKRRMPQQRQSSRVAKRQKTEPATGGK